MDIFLNFKALDSYEKLKSKIINGNAPTLSKIIYNEDNTQSICQFNLNDYNFFFYGFPKLLKSTMSDIKYVCFMGIKPKIIGTDNRKGDFIEFNF